MYVSIILNLHSVFKKCDTLNVVVWVVFFEIEFEPNCYHLLLISEKCKWMQKDTRFPKYY